MSNQPHHWGPRLTRRQLLRLLAAGGLLGLGGSLVRAQSEDIRRRAIPASGETLPVVGLGTSRTFDVGETGLERDPLREVLRRFAAAGASVVDTSPMYGRAESVIGDLTGELDLRPKLFLATKVWTSGREAGIRQMQASMRKLGADTLDLIQVHNLVDTATHLETLREWKAEGRVRYTGVTHYHSGAYGELEQVMRDHEFDFVQLNYSLIEREAERRLLPLARERGLAVIVNRPFARGALFRGVRGKPLPPWAREFDCQSWAQFFLKFILGHPAVTCAIPATSDPQHVVDNVQAAYGRLPDAEQRERMVRVIREL